MPKRFIDTEIFRKKWFFKLTKDEKLLWIYIFTNCNHSGIIDFNETLAEVETGIKDIHKVINSIQKQLIKLDNGHYFIPDFISFQYKELTPNNPAHKSVISTLKKLNLYKKFLAPSKGLPRGYLAPKENDKDKDKEKDKDKDKNKHKYNKIDLSFINKPDFKDLFIRWLDYRKEIKKPYKSNMSVLSAYKNLLGLSNSDITIAKKIVEQSIGNQWLGLFDLKEGNYGNNIKPTGKSDYMLKQAEKVHSEIEKAKKEKPISKTELEKIKKNAKL